MAKTITKKSSKSTTKTPVNLPQKTPVKTTAKSPVKITKPLANASNKEVTKKPKNRDVKNVKNDNSMTYFWGGLGIVLCAAGALIVLLWGIGAMLNK